MTEVQFRSNQRDILGKLQDLIEMYESGELPEEEIVNMALALSKDVLKSGIKPYFAKAGLANESVATEVEDQSLTFDASQRLGDASSEEEDTVQEKTNAEESKEISVPNDS